jgi:hypothetical protein
MMERNRAKMTKRNITRRELLHRTALATAASVLGSTALAGANSEWIETVPEVDHIMWGVSDLDRGIAYIEDKTGLKAVFGGQHPSRGTRNALISLGERQYLEILAPDPEQPDVREGRVEVLKGLAQPRILTWAAGANEIESIEKRVRAAGFITTGVIAGSRKKPNGTLLRWKSLAVNGHDGDVVPFLIEWNPGSTHPAFDSPKGSRLNRLNLEHPNPDKMNGFLKAMGLKTQVNRGRAPKITALIDTPKGQFQLT